MLKPVDPETHRATPGQTLGEHVTDESEVPISEYVLGESKVRLNTQADRIAEESVTTTVGG